MTTWFARHTPVKFPTAIPEGNPSLNQALKSNPSAATRHIAGSDRIETARRQATALLTRLPHRLSSTGFQQHSRHARRRFSTRSTTTGPTGATSPYRERSRHAVTLCCADWWRTHQVSILGNAPRRTGSSPPIVYVVQATKCWSPTALPTFRPGFRSGSGARADARSSGIHSRWKTRRIASAVMAPSSFLLVLPQPIRRDPSGSLARGPSDPPPAYTSPQGWQGRSTRGALKSNAPGWGAGRNKISGTLNFQSPFTEIGFEPTPPESMAIQSPLKQGPKSID